jgi:hypothetical protein
MKKVILLSSVLCFIAGSANAATPIDTSRILTYATVGAVVGGVIGGVLCMGHPLCIIAGAKISTFGGIAVGAGVGAASGTGVAVVAH